MSYPVAGEPDDRHAILAPQGVRVFLTLSLVLLAVAVALTLLSRQFGPTPGLYGGLFGAVGIVTLVMGVKRWFSRHKPRLWLDGDMLEYRNAGGGTVLFNLLTLGGAYVTVRHVEQIPYVYLDFRIDTEEEHFRKTGDNPGPRSLDYLNRVPMMGVVGIDSAQAQYFADEINRRRGLHYD
ncbi:MAG: hypothetical protein JWR51_2390 [Devosia sp.]|uniref:DUF202 domain-containing protein n=1 Tax=Devosia sp. TaxID=1871048 RepID=UPI00261FA671|nr:DUF202 domain-containing protein [Devosia sp.]MDB5529287.1 hypothetical protein [Devosia sp.]